MPAYVNPQTSFFDKLFNENNIQSYILSIQLGLHGLIFSVYDADKNKIIVLESFRFAGIKDERQITDEIKSVSDRRKWLILPFKKVNIIYTNQKSTLVPNALFVEKNKESFLNFNHPKKEKASIQFNTLKNAGLVNIFSIPDILNNQIKTIWPGSAALHFSTVLIESILINYKNKVDNNSLFVQLHKDYFELVFLKDSKLFFHNTFKFKTKEDFIYFLLATIDQLKLNPETVKLILLGDFSKSSIFYEMVFRYIRNSEFIEKNDTFLYSYLLDKIAHHQFYTLFNVLQCE